MIHLFCVCFAISINSLIINIKYVKLQVRPHIPQLDSIQLSLNTNPDSSPSCSGSMDSLDTDTLTIEAMEESLNFSADLKSSNIKGKAKNFFIRILLMK